MEMQINVNTKIIYMDSAVPVMRAIENVKRDIRKVCCDSDEKGCDIVLIMENMQAEQFEIKKKKPNVILMDIRMPGIDGVECTRLVKEKYPDIYIIVLTTFDDDEYIFGACSARGG